MAPEGWAECTVDEIKSSAPNALATGPFGSAISSRYFVSHGVPVIRGGNLSHDVGTRLSDDGLAFVSEKKAGEFSRSIARRGDLIFTCWGTIDQVGLVDDRSRFPEYVVSNKQMKLTPDPQKASGLFLYYLFASPLMRDRILNQGIGSSVPGFNLGQLRTISLNLPPLQEQRAIAHILGTLDNRIELNRRMNETLEAIARALFKSWFVDATQDGLPENWAESELGEIAFVIDCLHSKKPDRQSEGKSLLQLSNIRDDSLIDMTDAYYIAHDDYQQWISRMEASPGDCVITNVGRVAATAQIPEGLRAALGRNMTGIRCRPEFPYPTFLIECLRSSAMKEEITLKTDSGTILDALNVRNIPKLRFIRPTNEEAGRFESACRPLRARMEHNLEESHTLAALRDTLLPKLISGELRVKDAERMLGNES